jgi:hypothetical protein
MADVKDPAIDTEAFRTEGPCCGIRLPVLSTLTESGITLAFTPETRAQLIVEVPRQRAGPNRPAQLYRLKDRRNAVFFPRTFSPRDD